jgi:hypothetical protein
VRSHSASEWGCFEARPDKEAHSLARRPDASFQIFLIYTRARRQKWCCQRAREREKERRGIFSGTRKQDEGKPGSRCSNRSPTTYAAPAEQLPYLSRGGCAAHNISLQLGSACSDKAHAFFFIVIIAAAGGGGAVRASVGLFFLSLMNF